MCGRYSHRYTWKQLQRLLNLMFEEFEIPVRHNVAPSQTAPIVRDVGKGGRRLDLMRWGLIPSWAKDESFRSKAINARAETVATAAAFRDSFKCRRCLVPVSGFYEWKKLDESGKRKQPYYITSSDGEPMMLAGLWSSWKRPDAKALETFTIITTTPNELMAKLHDRMPVILGESDWDAWLDPHLGEGTADPGGAMGAVESLLRPYAPELMMAWPVSMKVNSPKNDGQELIQEAYGQEFPSKEEPGLFS